MLRNFKIYTAYFLLFAIAIGFSSSYIRQSTTRTCEVSSVVQAHNTCHISIYHPWEKSVLKCKHKAHLIGNSVHKDFLKCVIEKKIKYYQQTLFFDAAAIWQTLNDTYATYNQQSFEVIFLQRNNTRGSPA